MDIGATFLTTRWMARLPIAIFRAGFGFIFGGRLLLLEHRGRTSGESRFVVIEAADREAPDRVVVASGFGTRAQWYRNLEAEPRCGVSIGWRRRVPARAELLGTEESRRLLERYGERRPATWAVLERSIQDATGEAHPEIPMVRLHLE
ncbi:nitroreductase family deazaflavin-dependent oxidoreductase [Agromyces laixinhei]|uniref:nitroreductase family deazaflavin-dependent oxidoreductase n=1 Tax=Agromyces laixinhei TaxID=2585717 RepID=UPI001115DF1A|nr:nitroreductase family deazaflavin-dependent oxidoreductase [Agromyces laixinhei]